jgi:hypothetical protein
LLRLGKHQGGLVRSTARQYRRTGAPLERCSSRF